MQVLRKTAFEPIDTPRVGHGSHQIYDIVLSQAQSGGSDEYQIHDGDAAQMRLAVEDKLQRPGEMQGGKAVSWCTLHAISCRANCGNKVVEKRRKESSYKECSEAGHTLLAKTSDKSCEYRQGYVNDIEKEPYGVMAQRPMINCNTQTAVQAAEGGIDGVRSQIGDELIAKAEDCQRERHEEAEKNQLRTVFSIEYGKGSEQ